MRGVDGLRPAALALLAVVGASACAGSAPRASARAPAKEGDGSLVLDPAVLGMGKGASLAWIAYGVARRAAYRKLPPPAFNTSADDFTIELESRKIQTETWAQLRDDPASKPNPDLDRQLEIMQAGFLAELVVAAGARPGWTIPKESVLSLRLEEFARQFGGSYPAKRYAGYVPPGGTLEPLVPGGTFPDPAALPYGPGSCGRDLEARAAAWRRWDELEPKLGGAPVSATRTSDFGRQLIVLKRHPEDAARGVTWVSERVGYLAQLEGFCAIEAQDWARAQSMLTRAVALLPAEPSPRLELSIALLRLGHPRESLAQADRVLASSDDGCALARAWRRRGYILIDMGDLAGAKQAYEKSLEIDPGNPIAANELATIAGDATPRPGTFVAPEAPAVLVTTCRSQPGGGAATR